jgi:hypothetical protein
MIYDSTKVTDATAVVYQTATVQMLPALCDKGMRIISIADDGLSWQKAPSPTRTG